MMKTIKYPDISEWESLISRPSANQPGLRETVNDILINIKQRGDEALAEYTEKFDGVSLETIEVSPEAIENAKNEIDEELRLAIQLAKSNIEKVHRGQLIKEPVVETMPGVKCWRKAVPIKRVGLYIPGGSAPLFSTVLMLGVPAKIAGCDEIILCTPPGQNGQIHPAILYTAWLTGIKNIYKAGGAQAIAAMAYGTETIPNVYKIFGPGNAYVTKAKEMVQQEGIAIDMPAGPSELLVIADESCNPAFVAADLLSQAEHGADSQVMLLSNSEEIINTVNAELKKQLSRLPRKEVAQKALENSVAIELKSLTECMDFSNFYAPEHLIIMTENGAKLADEVINAGSVFIGNYSCESAGDYASGTNHTLPTNAFAKSYSGVSVESFMKKITFQEITDEGIRNIGPAIEQMAEAEGLAGHKNAVTLRLKELHPPESLLNNTRDSLPPPVGGQALQRGIFSNIEKLVRPHLKYITPYSSARDEYNGLEGVFLDANENPYGDFNRYPDPYQSELKNAIGTDKNVDASSIFIGNGSDEIIDLLIRIFCRPGFDRVMTFEPTFGMYAASAQINNVEVIKVPLNEAFQIDVSKAEPFLEDPDLKLIFICSPNNPTGNSIKRASIDWLLQNFKGIVVIDEAYIDFSREPSWLSKLDNYSNLVVLQTLSKAKAMAGLRIGMAFANPSVIQYLNRIKPPYNVSSANQQLALEQLNNKVNKVEVILAERQRVTEALASDPFVVKVYPSDANFLLVEVDNADETYRKLTKQGIVVRNRTKQVKNCLRITIGNPKENDLLINAFKN